MHWIYSWMYKEEIISFSRAGLLVPNLLCLAKIHKKKPKKKPRDQSTIQNSENIKRTSSDWWLHVFLSFLGTQTRFQSPLHFAVATKRNSSPRNEMLPASLSSPAHNSLPHSSSLAHPAGWDWEELKCWRRQSLRQSGPLSDDCTEEARPVNCAPIWCYYENMK